MARSKKPLESQIQRAFFQLVRMQQDPIWSMVMATPNQGQRNIVAGARYKAEGMSAGFPDISVLVPRGGHHGLFIELKRPGGRATQSQKDWLKRLNEMGYRAALIATDDAGELFKFVQDYLES